MRLQVLLITLVLDWDASSRAEVVGYTAKTVGTETVLTCVVVDRHECNLAPFEE